MKRFFLAAFFGSVLTANAQNIWINEFHYDNNSTDVGEFIEVIAPSSFTDLASVTITLYNGSVTPGTAVTYSIPHLLSSFTAGETINGFTTYSKFTTANGIQNGISDGISLDVSGTVLQFLSYEGTITADIAANGGGPAAGLTSVDIGVSEPDPGTPVGYSLGLVGTGSTYASFTWAVMSDDTPGAVNVGQTLTPIPEPHSMLLLGGGLLALLAISRRRR